MLASALADISVDMSADTRSRVGLVNCHECNIICALNQNRGAGFQSYTHPTSVFNATSTCWISAIVLRVL